VKKWDRLQGSCLFQNLDFLCLWRNDMNVVNDHAVLKRLLPLLFTWFFVSSSLVAALVGNGTLIQFDPNNDNVVDAVLTVNGLGISNTSPSANLHVTGNTIVTGSVIVGGTTNSSSSNLHINGTIGYSTQNVLPGTNTITNSSFVLADTSTGNVVLQLPDASRSGQQITIKRISSLNNLYISGAGNTMDGFSTLVFGAGNFTTFTMVSSGQSWYILGQDQNETLAEVGSSNLFLWWKLDETSGNTASDASSLSRSGNLDNDHQFSGNSVAGVLGTALMLDDAYDTVAYSAGGLPTGKYSYSLWLKSNHNGSDTISYEPEIAGSAGFVLASSNTLFHKSAYHKLSNGEYVTTAIASTLSANTWYYLGVSWSGSELSVYLNGQRESGNTAATTWAGGSNILLSQPGVFSSETISLDDLRFYNTALSATQIEGLYRSGKP
jgi:hypothetical protein